MYEALSTNVNGVNDVAILVNLLWRSSENFEQFKRLLTGNGVEFTVDEASDGGECVVVEWGTGVRDYSGGVFYASEFD